MFNILKNAQKHTHKYRNTHTNKQEMECLEENLEVLSSDCRAAVSEYIKDVDRDPSLGQIYLKYCTPMWENHCVCLCVKVMVMYLF